MKTVCKIFRYFTIIIHFHFGLKQFRVKERTNSKGIFSSRAEIFTFKVLSAIFLITPKHAILRNSILKVSMSLQYIIKNCKAKYLSTLPFYVPAYTLWVKPHKLGDSGKVAIRDKRLMRKLCFCLKWRIHF